MTAFNFRRYWTPAFLIASVLAVGAFLYASNLIVKDLAEQERSRMQIWANATKEIVNLSSSTDTNADLSNIDFLLGIIEANNNIPVLLTDARGNIVQQRNFDLPDQDFSDAPLSSPENLTFLQRKLASMKKGDNVIDIEISPGVKQHLYYEDSTLLRRLSRYPYIQLIVMGAFVLVIYMAVTSTKRAEQNKVWVGLSKETAHQLGTPISSLMAWIEMMRVQGIDPDMVDEMDKDVRRLDTIASRFSKIGSQPKMENANLNEVAESACTYMRGRISRRINLQFTPADADLPVCISAPLMEWVMENLIKNAVDAMDGSGAITVTTACSPDNKAIVEVTDTGRGMTRKMRKEVFRPGFTTKKRGWGLGLTLARRIVEQYHGGRICVSASEPGIGTTFRITLPISHTQE